MSDVMKEIMDTYHRLKDAHIEEMTKCEDYTTLLEKELEWAEVDYQTLVKLHEEYVKTVEKIMASIPCVQKLVLEEKADG